MILIVLIIIGTVAVYGATSGTKLNGLHTSNWIQFVVFLIPMLVIAMLDYRVFTGKLSFLFYMIGIAMLVLVQLIGSHINGAVRWLNFGSFQVQPSELVKVFTILLAAHLLHKRAGEKLRLFQDIVPLCVVFLIPTVLIMKQPDLGTSLVFVGIFLSMLWIGNMRTLYMLLCLGLVGLAVGAILWLYYADYELLSQIVKPHQMARIQTFLDPTHDPDKSWHVQNAIRAIGSGGMGGDNQFYLQNGYIPYAYSDSIYVVIGEKYGFLGSSVLLICYFILIYRLVIVAMNSRELIGSYVVIGITGMLVFQIFINIGMHIGLVPLTGISLPFISYGGSSLLTNMIAIGLVMSVSIHHDSSI
ncbi:FtsW/RodA/SpoVE family cell cycle protein [Paenibacillus filicis]|uniref:FtsW/RodA/SpoVE family cell cycle protein n=1 Tax=Paenibacillus filicis TaxID=669464 RepID=A0ABU9DEE2_9BACL